MTSWCLLVRFIRPPLSRWSKRIGITRSEKISSARRGYSISDTKVSEERASRPLVLSDYRNITDSNPRKRGSRTKSVASVLVRALLMRGYNRSSYDNVGSFLLFRRIRDHNSLRPITLPISRNVKKGTNITKHNMPTDTMLLRLRSPLGGRLFATVLPCHTPTKMLSTMWKQMSTIVKIRHL